MTLRPLFYRRLIRRLAGVPLSPSQVESSLCLMGDLNRWGWSESLSSGPTIGGAPVPWLSYAAVIWMWRLLAGDERVLEVGAGNSTRWFAERAAHVVSVESSYEWYARLSEDKPTNVELVFQDARDPVAYIAQLEALSERHGPFDIIVIDGGPDRVTATVRAASHLKETGIIVLDNSDVSEYQPAVSHLADTGFRRLDFFGPSPGSRYLQCTSVFSRDFDRWLARAGSTVLPVPMYEEPRRLFRT